MGRLASKVRRLAKRIALGRHALNAIATDVGPRLALGSGLSGRLLLVCLSALVSVFLV